MMKGMSIPAAADAVDMNRSYWYQVETGRRNPGLGRLALFARALECTVPELLTDEQPLKLDPVQVQWLRLLDNVPQARLGDAFAWVARLGVEAAVESDPTVAMSQPGRPDRKIA
jgi:transcriptional regulator with XRE-family HTH domain